MDFLLPMNNLITEDPAYLRDFFDHASIGFHVFGPDRVIIDINEAELQMIGYGREEIVGRKTWAELIVPEQGAVFEQHWQNILAVGRVCNIPYTLVHKDKHHVEVILNATARFDNEGHLLNTRGSVIDVTQRNQMERRLEQNNLALNEILAQLQEEKKKIKANVVGNVEQLIHPLLAKLKRKGSPLDQRNIELLSSSIEQITTEFGSRLADPQWRLSRREIEICHMIKNGMSTKNIADLLSVSSRTVDNHRDNIRKKLNISAQNINLTTFLRSFH